MIPRPPAHVQSYVDALGAATAVRFLLHFGGAELYIPRDPMGGSELVEVLGMAAARALSALADRAILPRRVPIPKPWLARYLKITAGLSHAEIARKENDFALCVNGGAVVTDTLGQIPPGMAVLRLGTQGGTLAMNGHLRRAFLYPTRKSNADLIAMTA